MPPVEVEADARQIQMLIVFALFRIGITHANLLADHDVREILVERLKRRFRRRVAETNHQLVVDEAHGVIVAVEFRNHLHRV